MDLIISIVLGIIQGLTEFLPVSSSGHLELAKFILGDDSIGTQSMLMTVVLHFGTALATILFFWKDILAILKNLFSKGEQSSFPFASKIVLSMLPAAFVGILFEDQIDALFSQNIRLVCAMLIVTAILLWLADRAKTSGKDVTYVDSIVIGLAQAIAIMPGISRSGATISISTLLGVDREKAARFSFLMVVPLIFGKMVKDLIDGDFNQTDTNYLGLTLGFFAALITGYLACKWMITLVKKAKLKYFAIYCVIIGFVGIIYTYI